MNSKNGRLDEVIICTLFYSSFRHTNVAQRNRRDIGNTKKRDNALNLRYPEPYSSNSAVCSGCHPAVVNTLLTLPTLYVFFEYEVSSFYDIAVPTVNFKNALLARRFSLLSSKAKVLGENRIIF